jgi:hypothetical protein
MDRTIKLNTIEPSETSVPIFIDSESIKLQMSKRKIPVYLVIQNIISAEQFPKEFTVDATSGEAKSTFHFVLNGKSGNTLAMQNVISESARFGDLELVFHINTKFLAEVSLIY